MRSNIICQKYQNILVVINPPQKLSESYLAIGLLLKMQYDIPVAELDRELDAENSNEISPQELKSDTEQEQQKEPQIKQFHGKDYLEFQFPNSSFSTKNWFTTERVRKYLRESCTIPDPGLKGQMFRQVVSDIDHRVIYQCKQCTTKIILKCDEDNQTVQKILHFQNKHSHLLSSENDREKEMEIVSFLEGLPFENMFEQKPREVKKMFKVELDFATETIKKHLKKYNSMKAMIKKLEKNGRGQFFQAFANKSKTESENVKRYFIFMVTPFMRECYQKYGDYVCFDSVRKLLILPRSDQDPEAVFFTGQDTHLRVVLFAVGILYETDSLGYVNLFTEFFKAMEKQPQCLITDQKKQVIDAVGILKKKFKKQNPWSHGISCQEVMKKIRGKLEMSSLEENKKDSVAEFYEEAMIKFGKDNFDQYIKKIAKESKKDDYLEMILRNFTEKQSRYCMPHLDRKMYGFSLEDFRSESFSRCLEKNFPHGSPLKLIFYTLYYQNNLKERIQNFQKIEKIRIPYKSDCEEMAFLSDKIESNIYEVLLDNYERMKEIQYVKIQQESDRENHLGQIDLLGSGEDEDLIKDSKNKGKKKGRNSSKKDEKSSVKKSLPEFKYTAHHSSETQDVTRRSVYEFWSCTCRFRNITGIPCKHIMGVVLKTGQKITPYIAKRWFYGEEEKLEQEQWYNEATLMKESQEDKQEDVSGGSEGSEAQGEKQEDKFDDEGFQAEGKIQIQAFADRTPSDSEDDQIVKVLR